MIVVKVGGSLYDWPGLGPALRAFVAALNPAPVLLVPGGGGFADAVRALHHAHGFTEEQAHWLAIDSLWPAAKFLSQLLGAGLTDSPTAKAARVTVFDVTTYCRSYPVPLPHSWDVTTDSLAAWVARAARADRLILLKSVDVPPGTSWDEAAARGWVDGYFTRALAGFAGRVEAVNLRTWQSAG
ncbi:MAG: hypothetical protein U0804_22340 [Gemmataceae bacterium]